MVVHGASRPQNVPTSTYLRSYVDPFLCSSRQKWAGRGTRAACIAAQEDLRSYVSKDLRSCAFAAKNGRGGAFGRRSLSKDLHSYVDAHLHRCLDPLLGRGGAFGRPILPPRRIYVVMYLRSYALVAKNGPGRGVRANLHSYVSV